LLSKFLPCLDSLREESHEVVPFYLKIVRWPFAGIIKVIYFWNRSIIIFKKKYYIFEIDVLVYFGNRTWYIFGTEVVYLAKKLCISPQVIYLYQTNMSVSQNK
jgi:hypothetical protein